MLRKLAWTVGVTAVLLAGLWAVQRYVPTVGGLEELSWVGGIGSFVGGVVSLVLFVVSGDEGTSGRAGAGPLPGWVETAVRAGAADASELGAHAARPGTDGASQTPYVARDADADLDDRLAAAAASARGGLVLVAGVPTAGKSRALAQAVARTMPDRMLVAPPKEADLRPLPAWLTRRSGRAPRGWVVWLDDLDRHLPHAHLDPALVTELGRANAIVVATIRREQLRALRPTATTTGAREGVGYPVLRTPHLELDRKWSARERDRARDTEDSRLVQAADQTVFGVAEHVAAGPQLRDDWRAGPDSGHPRGYALVAAAVDLARAGLSTPLTRAQIETAADPYLPAPPPLPEDPDDAWRWATQERSGVAGLLVPADRSGNRWRAFDYLTTDTPIPDTTWRTALDLATHEDRITIGFTAYAAGEHTVAEAAYGALAEIGVSGAMINLGLVLVKTGRVEEAEEWYRRAVDAGHRIAMTNLGNLLMESGRVEEAEQWYWQAIEAGSDVAGHNLRVLLSKSGWSPDTEQRSRRAAEAGHPEAMYVLGFLLAESGRVAEAEGWYRRAAEAGHTEAMANLGLLLEEDRAEEAEDWYRRAAEAGEVIAMVNLGVLLLEEDRPEEAEEWYRRAAEAGEVIAMVNLGVLLAEAGRLEEAEPWSRRAVEAGHPEAMSLLGYLLAETGRPQEAEQWLRRAAEAGQPEARDNLGSLLMETGRARKAGRWWRRARGNP